MVEEVQEDSDDNVEARLRYVDQAGETHVEWLDVTDADEAPEPFDEIPVVYDPDEPDRVVLRDLDPVDSWVNTWIGRPFAVLMPGGLALLVLKARRKSN